MRIEHLDWRRFDIDTARFQQRTSSHAETVAAAIAAAGWRIEKAQLFHVWPDGAAPLWVLDGHSRLEGLRRLAVSAAPATVVTAVHDHLDEHAAVTLSKELNASPTPFTPCEMGRIVKAEREQLSDMNDRTAYAVLAQRFTRYTANQLMGLATYAFLPSEIARLVDAEEIPPLAARALGRFARDTGADPETITRIGLNFIRSGAGPGTLRKFLRETARSAERVTQDDMFGTCVVTRLHDVEGLRRRRTQIHQLRRLIAIRREVFEGLEGTEAAGTAAQRALLDEDAALDDALASELDEIDDRISDITRFNAA